MATEETIKRRAYHAARYAENPTRYKRQRPEYFKEYYQNNKHLKRAYKLQTLYGITPEQYDEMLAAQDGRCGNCRELPKSNKRFAVDHDHNTGKVRGLLCDLCNRFIVFSVENYPAQVANAHEYLRQHA